MSHLTGENLQFIEQLYSQYLDDPSSVDQSWLPVFKEYFDAAEAAHINGNTPHFEPRSIFAAVVQGSGAPADDSSEFTDKLDGISIHAPGKTSGFAAQIENIVRAYRLFGHTASRIDPLGMMSSVAPPELDPSTYGLTAQDMDTPVKYEALFNGSQVTLGQILERLEELYCGPIAVEFQYISDFEQRAWLRREIERNNFAEIDGPQERVKILEGLIHADAFETFLHRKYVGAKRFSLTGGDSLIPMLRAMLDEGGDSGMEEALFGMAHRGRLNVLHNIMGKPAENMFSEFEKTKNPEKYIGSSDVKYHMGYSSDYLTPSGNEVHLSLAFNPSHLEFVDPVVIGRARAKQARTAAPDPHRAVMPILIHGDAAFAGQGVVAETFNISQLEGYTVGGTMHIVINNQIGFTTLPTDSRSTRYSTDIAKIIEAPILHVNGDDPEACVRAAKLAMRYRQHFGRDIVIDLVCYRQYGHNEGDEPRFTQPEMYKVIDGKKHVRETYADSLVTRKILTEADIKSMWDKRMEEEYAPAFKEVQAEPRSKSVSSLGGLWSKFRGGAVSATQAPETGVAREELDRLASILSFIPEGVEAHRTIKRLFKTRAKMAAGEQALDWGFAESLAFGSLLSEGTNIRLTGQDSIRGTFSHRHAAVFDTTTGQKYWPARHLNEDQGTFEVANSSLSETAILGFEYGYSLDSPDCLVGWEAQFGDFVNGAQVIIDQFINSGEDKWDRLSGLVMLLPHGYEGQGPEHSSARLERFLQLCAEDNMFVTNPTTPSQYFHLLRRQILQDVRKPLIVMTPKSLLRLRDATSSLDELSTGRFQEVLPEVREDIEPAGVKRALLCSGKIYYDLVKHAKANGITDAAIIRVEQLYPLAGQALEDAVSAYTNLERIVWVQEEPKNMGPWSFMFPELVELFGASPLPVYVGREASASPATGDPEAHRIEQEMLVTQAFNA